MGAFERPRPDPGTEREVVRERIVAFAIDAIGFLAVFGILGVVLGAVFGPRGIASGIGTVAFLAYLLIYGLQPWIVAAGTATFLVYVFYFEAVYGQTIGKTITDVVVVTETGDPIGYRESAIRTVLRLVDVLPFFYVVGLVSIFLTDRTQRVGDVAANTVVVRTNDSS